MTEIEFKTAKGICLKKGWHCDGAFFNGRYDIHVEYPDGTTARFFTYKEFLHSL